MVVIVAIGFSAQGIISSQLAAWDLLPKDDAAVELYFTEPTSLPTIYTPGKSFAVKGTIHNAGKETKQHTYMITQAGDGVQDIVLHEASFKLSPGESLFIEQSITPSDTGKRANFSLKLKDTLQHINFWSTKK